MKLAFTVEYDGGDFSGFQRQTNAITIQEKIEDAIEIITNQKVSINYAGRTDAGVHALSQVFDFSTQIDRDCHDWIKGINSNLPKSIQVKHMINVSEEFHSRFLAKTRTYGYVIFNSRSKPLFFNNYVHWEKTPLDFEILKREGEDLLGTYDFSSFRSSSCSANNPIKDITNFKAEKFNDFIILHITANAFLHNMVRIIMGTLVDISKSENKMSIKDIIAAKDRNFAGRTLSAKGLFFLGPEYDDLYKIPKPSKNIMDKFKV